MREIIVALLVGLALCGCSRAEYEDENIRITQYTGVESGALSPTAITDADVDAEIGEILDANAEKAETSRAAGKGDIVVIDYTSETDSSLDLELPVTADGGLQESLAGHKKGERYEWVDPVGNIYTVTVKMVMEKHVPELTDAFVKTVSRTTGTVKEFRGEVKKQLEDRAEREYRAQLADGAFDAVLANTEVLQYPDLTDIENEIKTQYQEAANDSGVDYETYIRDYIGQSLDKFDEGIQEASKAQAKETMAVRAIADQEKLIQTEKEQATALEALAKEYGYEDAAAMEKDIGRDRALSYAMAYAVREWLADHAK